MKTNLCLVVLKLFIANKMLKKPRIVEVEAQKLSFGDKNQTANSQNHEYQTCE